MGRPKQSGGIPPHPKDPIGKNPWPPDHPANAVWERATREAEKKLHQLEANHLAKRPNPFEDPGTWWLELYVGRFQIWAERALATVVNYKGARMYEQWLEAYRESWLKALKDNPPHGTVPALLLAVLGNNLQGAVSHWAAVALDQAATIEAGTTADRRIDPSDMSAKVQAFIDRVFTYSGRGIKRQDIVLVMGHESPREFQKVVSGDASATKAARMRLDAVLALSAEKFLEFLDKKQAAQK